MTTETTLVAAMPSESPPQEIDWLAFCDRESTRYAFDAPWVKSNWKFATNSRVMVAVPTGEPDSPPCAKGRRYANALELLEPILSRELDWQLLPKFEQCEKCENKGKITAKCSRCRGFKEAECDMGHWHKCQQCDEHGQEYEQCCCFVMVGGRRLHSEHFEKVAALPDVRWCVLNSDIEQPVYFRFGELSNCFAIAMPLRKDAGDDSEWTERKAVME